MSKNANAIKTAWGGYSLKDIIRITHSDMDKLVKNQVKNFEDGEEIKTSGLVKIVVAFNSRSEWWYLFYITPKMRAAEIQTFRDKFTAKRYAQAIAEMYEAKAKRLEERRKKREEERANFQNPYKVGDIIYSSWGYEQTNIDFYLVVAVSKQSVKIVEIGKKYVGSRGQDDLVVPDKNKKKGTPMIKRVDANGGVKISSYEYATKWNNRPMGQTNPMFGH